MSGGSAAATRGADAFRRRSALDLVTGAWLLLAVAAAAVLPDVSGPVGRTDWVEVTEPIFWVLLALWACGSALRRTQGSAWQVGLRAAALVGAGLLWSMVLAHAAGRGWPAGVGPVVVVVVVGSVAVGTVAGELLRRARPGPPTPAYVLGRVVVSPAVGPLLAAGRTSVPLYFASHLMMLGLLTWGEPVWAHQLGEWAEPYALGHNRAAVVLIVVGFWAAVVGLLHLSAPTRAADRPTRE